MNAEHRPTSTGLALKPAGEGDFEALLALRMAAMRESRERAGRVDPQRAPELTAAKHSAANRFYLRHGFVLQAEGERDLHCRRPACRAAGNGCFARGR